MTLKMISNIVPFGATAAVGAYGTLAARKSEKSKKVTITALKTIKKNIEETRRGFGVPGVSDTARWTKDFFNIVPVFPAPRAGNAPFGVDLSEMMERLKDSPLNESQDDFSLVETTALNILEKIVDKGLGEARTRHYVDKGNKISAALSVLSAAGNITSVSLQNARHVQAASIATNVAVAASGLCILSSVFSLGASVRGLMGSSKKLAENRAAQAEVESDLEWKSSLKDNPAKCLDSGLTLDQVKKDISFFTKKLEILKSEETALIQSKNYYILNTIGALMSLAAAILFIFGTHGLGLVAVIAYYILVSSGVVLPVAAEIYRFICKSDGHFLDHLDVIKKQITSTGGTFSTSQVAEQFSAIFSILFEISIKPEELNAWESAFATADRAYLAKTLPLFIEQLYIATLEAEYAILDSLR